MSSYVLSLAGLVYLMSAAPSGGDILSVAFVVCICGLAVIIACSAISSVGAMISRRPPPTAAP